MSAECSVQDPEHPISTSQTSRLAVSIVSRHSRIRTVPFKPKQSTCEPSDISLSADKENAVFFGSVLGSLCFVMKRYGARSLHPCQQPVKSPGARTDIFRAMDRTVRGMILLETGQQWYSGSFFLSLVPHFTFIDIPGFKLILYAGVNQ